ncbi:MAG: 3'-5' exonuclease [Treponema sp.]|jgi:DNA polymerase-3 subunit epsilon|nr:3'-5' exonuclease [Treponema sp.]
MNDFIAIDFETATESPESAVSVGLVKYRNYQSISAYYSLIRPPNLYIRSDFTEIHGLTVEDVKDAPDFNYIWKNEIKRFIGKTLLAAHNASFDMKVLKAVLGYYELPIPRLPYFCTLYLSRHAWPKLKSHALTSLAKEFGIIYNAHNALDDAYTCGKLVQLAVEEFNHGKEIEKLLEYMCVGIKCLR